MGRSEVSTTRAPSSSAAPPGRGRKRLSEDERHERSPGPRRVKTHKSQGEKAKKRKDDQSEEKRVAVPAKRMRGKTPAVQFLGRLSPVKSHPSVQQLPLEVSQF